MEPREGTNEEFQQVARSEETPAETPDPAPSELGEATAAEFKFLIKPEERLELAKRVDELVERAHRENLGALVFLDRSARPLAWLFRDLWQARYPSKAAPPINFLQVGSEFQKSLVRTFEERRKTDPTFELMYEEYKELLDRYVYEREREINNDATVRALPRHTAQLIEQLTDQDVAEVIGTAHLAKEPTPEEQTRGIAQGRVELQRVSQKYTPLREAEANQQPVLVVDEYLKSGRSLALAQRILRAAFPNLSVMASSLITAGDPTFHNPQASSGEGSDDYNPAWREIEQRGGRVIGVANYPPDSEDSNRDEPTTQLAIRLTAEPVKLTEEEAAIESETIESQEKMRETVTEIIASQDDLKLLAQSWTDFLDQTKTFDAELVYDPRDYTPEDQARVASYYTTNILPKLQHIAERFRTTLTVLIAAIDQPGALHQLMEYPYGFKARLDDALTVTAGMLNSPYRRNDALDELRHYLRDRLPELDDDRTLRKMMSNLARRWLYPLLQPRLSAALPFTLRRDFHLLEWYNDVKLPQLEHNHTYLTNRQGPRDLHREIHAVAREYLARSEAPESYWQD